MREIRFDVCELHLKALFISNRIVFALGSSDISESIGFRPITNRPILYSFELKCPNIKNISAKHFKIALQFFIYILQHFKLWKLLRRRIWRERGGIVVHLMPNGMRGLVVADQRATGRTQSGRMLLSLETSWGQLGSTPAGFLVGAWKSYETRALLKGCVCWLHT